MAIIILLCLSGLICVCGATLLPVFYFRTRRQFRQMRDEINGLSRKLQQMESRAETGNSRPENRLTEKQLSERFEAMAYGRIRVSPKYRHVAQLARSGLGVADIAEILEVSQKEAEQMLELAGSYRQPA